MDPTTIALAAIVVMVIILIAIGMSLAGSYSPRLIWLSEHLIERPTYLVVVLTIVSAIVAVAFIIIEPIRKKTGFRSLWLFSLLAKRGELRR